MAYKKDDLVSFLEIIEKSTLDEERLAKMNDYERGKAEGYLKGMLNVALQVRAIIEPQVNRKPLTLGCSVFIRFGPWADHHGIYQGSVHMPIGRQALILIDGTDLPVEVDEKYVEVT